MYIHIMGGTHRFELASLVLQGGRDLIEIGQKRGPTFFTEHLNGGALSGSSSPASLTAAGDLLFFSADDGAHGRELWALCR